MAANKTRYNPNSFKSVAVDIFKDFAENTSIHGIQHTVKNSSSIYQKAFWILVILVCVTGAGHMTVLFWRRYNGNPTRTSILTDYASNTAIPFPAITICNINRIMKNQMDHFIKTLKIEDEDVSIVTRAFPQLLAFTSNYDQYNQTDLEVLERVLVENDYGDIRVVMKKITQPCERLLVKCSWAFQTLPCSKIMQETYSTDGHCCSFNYIKDYEQTQTQPLRSPYTGFNGGLKLLLKPEVQPVQYAFLQSVGLTVRVHGVYSYPGSGAIYKIIAAGRQSYLEISATKIVSSRQISQLTVDQRECVYASEVRLKYFRRYSDSNCVTECEEQYLFSKCGCVPFYYPFTKHKICNISNIPCLDKSIGTALINNLKNCDCPTQCKETFYSAMLSSVTLSKEDSATTSSFLDQQNITNQSMTLYVFFGSQTQQILYKDTVTSTIYLLSSFGGVYSLFLGCSFISLVEILYYCTFRLPISLKTAGQTKPAIFPSIVFRN